MKASAPGICLRRSVLPAVSVLAAGLLASVPVAGQPEVQGVCVEFCSSSKSTDRAPYRIERGSSQQPRRTDPAASKRDRRERIAAKKASKLFRKRDWTRALAAYEEALRYCRGRCHYLRVNIAAVKRHLAFGRGRAHLRRGDWDAAVAEFRTILETCRDCDWWQTHIAYAARDYKAARADAYWNLRNWKAAVDWYRSAASHCQPKMDCRYLRYNLAFATGSAAWAERRGRDALVAFEQARKSCRKPVTCRQAADGIVKARGAVAMETALAAERRKDWRAAIEAYGTALGLCRPGPPCGSIRHRLALARDALKRQNEASRLSRRRPIEVPSPRAARKAPATGRKYVEAGTGLIGGTGWVYGMNAPRDAPEVRRRSLERLREQLRLAGVGPEDFPDPADYDFILGVATSYDFLEDLDRRVLKDQAEHGQHTARFQELYASLRGRSFERLDCHSNGAMVCLAALARLDARAARVRLFGPQITPESLERWQDLLEQGHVQAVEIYLNARDPVPAASFVWGRGTPSVLHSRDRLAAEIRRTAPRLTVRQLDCGRRSPADCHGMKEYQNGLRRSRISND